jgi:hypothetical protein
MADNMVFMDTVSKWLIFAIGLCLVVIIGYIDYLFGKIFILFLYFIPIGFVIWYVGCWSGSVITILSSFACCIADYKFLPALDDLYWNSISETVFLIFFAFSINYLRYAIKLKSASSN